MPNNPFSLTCALVALSLALSSVVLASQGSRRATLHWSGISSSSRSRYYTPKFRDTSPDTPSNLNTPSSSISSPTSSSSTPPSSTTPSSSGNDDVNTSSSSTTSSSSGNDSINDDVNRNSSPSQEMSPVKPHVVPRSTPSPIIGSGNSNFRGGGPGSGK